MAPHRLPLAGIAVAAISMCAGLATYAPAMVSVDVAQLLVVLLVVPALFALERPVVLGTTVRSLGAGSHGLKEVIDPRAAKLLGSPFSGAVATAGFVMALFRTPLIELSLRFAWVHLLVLTLAVLLGSLLLWPVLGARRRAENCDRR